MSKQGLVNEIQVDLAAKDMSTVPSASTSPAIPVLEESATVHSETVEVAKVKLSKSVETDREQVDLTTTEDHVVVTRVPKNEILDKLPDGVRYEGDIMIIPVLKEVAVVEKRIMLVEEIHVRKEQHASTKTVEVTLRKEKIDISREQLDSRRTGNK